MGGGGGGDVHQPANMLLAASVTEQVGAWEGEGVGLYRVLRVKLL